MEFTKEQLIERCRGEIECAQITIRNGTSDTPNAVAERLELFEIALASLTAEAVAWTEKCEITNMQATGLYLRGFPNNSQGRDIALYIAPPAPVVPDDENGQPAGFAKWANRNFATNPVGTMTLSYCEDAWRAAMLRGADGNSPVIPECSCRTCHPVTMTDMRFVVCPECGNKRCPHANDHRHACTGSNEPGQVGSAYPASPQQEVK